MTGLVSHLRISTTWRYGSYDLWLNDDPLEYPYSERDKKVEKVYGPLYAPSSHPDYYLVETPHLFEVSFLDDAGNSLSIGPTFPPREHRLLSSLLQRITQAVECTFSQILCVDIALNTERLTLRTNDSEDLLEATVNSIDYRLSELFKSAIPLEWPSQCLNHLMDLEKSAQEQIDALTQRKEQEASQTQVINAEIHRIERCLALAQLREALWKTQNSQDYRVLAMRYFLILGEEKKELCDLQIQLQDARCQLRLSLIPEQEIEIQDRIQEIHRQIRDKMLKMARPLGLQETKWPRWPRSPSCTS